MFFSRFYDYTVSNNGVDEVHKNDYEKDYFTDVIKRRAVSFIQNATDVSRFHVQTCASVVYPCV